MRRFEAAYLNFPLTGLCHPKLEWEINEIEGARVGLLEAKRLEQVTNCRVSLVLFSVARLHANGQRLVNGASLLGVRNCVLRAWRQSGDAFILFVRVRAKAESFSSVHCELRP